MGVIRKILLVIMLMMCIYADSQTKQEQIIEYVDAHIGQRVGDGVCRTLISKAYKFANIDDPFRGRSEKYCVCDFGDVVPIDSVIPGDVVLIVQFDSVTQTMLSSHIGIVYDYSLSIANQNYMVNRLRHSRVVITPWTEMMNTQYGVFNKVYFYRKR